MIEVTLSQKVKWFTLHSLKIKLGRMKTDWKAMVAGVSQNWSEKAKRVQDHINVDSIVPFNYKSYNLIIISTFLETPMAAWLLITWRVQLGGRWSVVVPGWLTTEDHLEGLIFIVIFPLDTQLPKLNTIAWENIK